MLPYYYSLNEYLKSKFNNKVYKLAINGGMSCPNRDGLIDTRGCIFCSAGGSGDFAQNCNLSITEQINSAKALLLNKYNGNSYIAYFQAFTNTYASVDYLRKIFTEAISHPDIVCISIGTRPDCISDEILSLLAELNNIKPVWIELGLQTIHQKSADYIRRGYTLKVFEDCVNRLRLYNIETIVHMIIGLPHESPKQILQTAAYLSSIDIQGIKLQLLHVLKNTDLSIDYENNLFRTLTLEEYIDILCNIIQILPADMVIHRITGDGNKKTLIAPLWSSNKRNVLNSINNELRKRNIIQGSKSGGSVYGNGSHNFI